MLFSDIIIGGDKAPVVENIRKHIKNGDFNKKAELDDPVLSDEDADKAIAKYNKRHANKIVFYLDSRGAVAIINLGWALIRKRTSFEGVEKLDGFKKGAIITCNHFNPLDSLFARALLKKKFHKTPYIVSQETNLAMGGFNGYLMRRIDMVPLMKRPNYILKTFIPRVKELVEAGEFVQIYPEEELWFNYRKPRPCKRGTYLFAAQAKAPVVPIFVEMIDTEKDDNDQFKELKYIVHVLDPIYPDPKKSDRQNSIDMAKQDYDERVACYEKVYGKKLDYKFSYSDIAGYDKGLKKTSSDK
ncbi:1-acyl-sn-glycerol-3-phosphate acyltransferase [Candidatus Saccharibacteria bacterium]|nr:1-acyl-sn-glycerol-3-phosphate acyltransferase [Candidatus Saccharibacteria bacterium]